MATNYTVMVYCEDEAAWKEMLQVDTINEAEVPTGCEAHTLKAGSFHVQDEEVV